MPYQQPQSGPPLVDWSNPITRSLAAVFDMTGNSPVNIISGYRAGSGQFVRLATQAGLGLKKTGTTSDGLASFLGANPTSAVVMAAVPSVATMKPFFSQRPSGGGAQWSFGANWNSGFVASAGELGLNTNGNINLSSTGAITGNLDVYGYTVDSATTGQLYIKGRPVATTVTGSGYPVISGPEFNLMSHTGAGASNDAAMPYLCLWNRALSPSEHASLAANPWQIFLDHDEEEEHLLYVQTAGGGITGTLASTEGSDTLAASGSVLVSGTLSQTEGADTISAAGSVLVGGTLAATEGSDTLAAAGSVASGVTGALAATEVSDTFAASGFVLIGGTLTRTEGADSLAATGSVLIGGTLAKTEGGDTLAAAGGAIGAPITGMLARTEGADTLAASNIVAQPGGGGAGGSVRDVREYARQFDEQKRKKVTKAQKKAIKRLLVAEALELLPDTPLAESVAPALANLAYLQSAPAFTGWQPNAMQPLPSLAERALRANVVAWSQQNANEQYIDEDSVDELLLLG